MSGQAVKKGSSARVLLTCCVLAFLGCSASGGAYSVEYRTLSLSDGTVLRYTLSRPKRPVDPAAGVPLVLVLHYSAPKDSIPAYYGAEILERLVQPAFANLGAVLVAPDAQGRSWGDPRNERAVLALLDHLRARMRVDERRTLVTGFSMGGMGTWYFVARHPERFRAAIPIASFPMLRDGRSLADREVQLQAMIADSADTWTVPFRRVPMYIIHSRADEVLPLAAVERAVAALRARGADAHLVRLDGVQHFQTRAYVESLRAAIPWIEGQWARPDVRGARGEHHQRSSVVAETRGLR